MAITWVPAIFRREAWSDGDSFAIEPTQTLPVAPADTQVTKNPQLCAGFTSLSWPADALGAVSELGFPSP